MEKDKKLAGILSFILPGLGQIYADKTGRGIAWFIGYFIAVVVGMTLEAGIPVIIILFALMALCILDAVEVVEKQNK